MLKEGFQSSISLLPFSLLQTLHFSWILALFARRATPFLKAMASTWCFLVFSFKSFRQNNHILIQPFTVHSLGWTEVKRKLYSSRGHKKKIQVMYYCVFPSQREIGPPSNSSPADKNISSEHTPQSRAPVTGIWAPLQFWTSRVNKYIPSWQSHCCTQLLFSYY